MSDRVNVRLRAFARWALRAEIVALEFEFAWPNDLHALGRCFTGYEWGRAVGPGPARVIGICPLQCRPPYELLNLEVAIFDPQQHATRSATRRGETLEYYLIVDLLAPETARAYLAMCAPPDKWYLLDQHQIARDTMQAKRGPIFGGSHS